ncbi:protein translocase subunit SecF [Aquihabitans sp. G128]|uniref:protein translocase subunit SecF n=1 Tax=Aquihabitans sp. G128 TaxID=2849779 RepID=UPI001C22D2CF|nr:protein translocase subunit SecF [Aquihabitans sp. G128]QXC61846.1 protein translocase subunit SecF [Aquihabitans sp. G128]
MTGPLTEQKPHGVLKRLYHGETRADIVGRWKMWFALSGVLLLIGLAGIATGGIKLGIDFTGGTVWQVEAGKAEVADVQKAMADLGYDDVQVQELTQAGAKGGDARFLRVEAEATSSPTKATTSALDKAGKGLRGLDVPDAAQGRIDAVHDNLDAIDGPFQTSVPAPLKAIQSEIDKLPARLKAIKGDAAKATSARKAAARMQADVDQLDTLEQAERSRVGQDVTSELAKLTGTPASQVTVDTVGPSWGKQISNKAQTALIVFLIAITIFITIRFELKMAIATVVALFHDLLIVIGLYAVFRFPITPATVVALLTMLGFSIYDGIVVFDRVNENTKLLNAKSKMTYTEMANLSLNQVLMRSLNTSITSLLPILSVLVVGAFVLGVGTLEEFGLALFLGLLSGAYSSIFIATPLLAMLKEREPQYRDLRAQIAERGHGTVVSKEQAREEDDPDPVKTAILAGPASRPTGPPPRPRKQGRKR